MARTLRCRVCGRAVDRPSWLCSWEHACRPLGRPHIERRGDYPGYAPGRRTGRCRRPQLPARSEPPVPSCGRSSAADQAIRSGVSRLAARVAGLPHRLVARVRSCRPGARSGSRTWGSRSRSPRSTPFRCCRTGRSCTRCGWLSRWSSPRAFRSPGAGPRRSLVVFVIGAMRVAYDQIGFGFAPFPLGPAIAFYTVIDRCRPVWRWIVTAAVVAGISISLATPGHSEPYQGIFQALIFLTAWAAGRAQPDQAGQPAGGAGPGRPRRGRARPPGVARRGTGARPDRPRAARRRGPPRQPDGGAGRGGARRCSRTARRRPGARWRSSGTRPGWP